MDPHNKQHPQQEEPTAFTTPGPVTEAASGSVQTVVNTTEVAPREAPVPSVAERDMAASAAAAQRAQEVVLDIGEIQGNILTAFNKDNETLLFLRIVEGQEEDFRRWLAALVPYIATLDDVHTFNALWKRLHHRIGENKLLQATWVNIAFSHPALQRLTNDAHLFTDESFKGGLAARAADLGDPTAEHAEGNPHNWLIGGPGNEADVIVIIASDDRDDMIAEVTRIEDSIFAPREDTEDTNGRELRSGVQIMFKQVGATLPSPLTGHEHFGFLDGVSQPGVRGQLSHKPNDFLTLSQNPDNIDQGKPGQDLLWPGEFVFGYPGQDAEQEVAAQGPVSDAGPGWAKNGSFLVFRRLRQDVAGFHHFLHSHAGFLGGDAGRLGAKLVGRWASGAPIMRAPRHDDLALAGEDCSNNNFEFRASAEGADSSFTGPALCDEHGLTRGDPAALDDHDARPDETGRVCPLGAHIRKSYPRNDIEEGETQTHRLLRRGIPFGEPLNETPDRPQHDAGNRGLLFLAYQTSIEEQFEFIITQWVNNPDFRDGGAGHDPILGQHNGAHDRKRRVSVRDDGGVVRTLELPKDWVIPTGGGYFFAPSLTALQEIADDHI